MSELLNAEILFATPKAGRGRMMPAPASFDGALGDLFDRHISPNLLTPDAMRRAHDSLSEYCRLADPLFLIRQSSGEVRGNEVRATAGRYRPTDNAPAWALHALLFHGWELPPAAELEPLMAVWPCHMFEIGRLCVPTVSASGWHVAHLWPVKQGAAPLRTRVDLVRRFIRGVHPCNYAFVPKPDWIRYGGDEQVLTFFKARFRERYSDVWASFCELAGADASVALADGQIAYRYGLPGASLARENEPQPTVGRCGPAIVTYRAARLLFRAALIEPLQDDESFRVETPEGPFQFTKREFYETFPRLVQTASYREKGIYHFPKVPRAALRFRC